MIFLNKNIIIVFSVFVFSGIELYCQNIFIKDSNTGAPIENVAVFSLDKKESVITDSLGKATIDHFSKLTPIVFQINGYKTITLDLNKSREAFIIQMEPKVENLDNVILSVARSRATKNKVAEKVNIISAEKIKQNSFLTGAEILELSPGIRIQKSQGGGGSPVIRGFEANRVLLVVDGVRMNNAIYRSGHLQNAITIAPHTLERVEVVFGSSSVGYGSDALGGVVHYYTKNPNINSDIKNKNIFHSDFNSANNASINNLFSEWSFKKWGSITSMNFSSFGDIRMGGNNYNGYPNWGLTNFYSQNTRNYYKATPTLNPNPLIQKNTAYSQWDILQKFRFIITGQSYLTLNIQSSKSSDISRYDKLNEIRNGELRYAEWYYGPQEHFMISPKLEFFNGYKWLRKGTITFAIQKIGESRVDRRFNSFTRRYQNEKVEVLSLNGDFTARPTNITSASYGFEFVKNKVESNAFTRRLVVNNNKIIDLISQMDIPARYPSKGSHYNTAAAYFNFIWTLNSSTTLNAGSRLTYTDLGGSWKEKALINTLLSKVSINNWALTSTLALTHKVLKNSQINVVLSSGFRNPNIDDIGKIRESGGYLIVPNPFLKPEYAYNLDSGFSYSSSNNLNNLSLRGFISVISRHIVRSDYEIFADTSTESLSTILYDGEELPTLANKNLGNRYIYGGSFQGRFSINENVFTQYSITYTKGNKNSKYGPMPSIPPLFGQFSAHFKNSRLQSRLIWSFSRSKNPTEYSYGGEDGLEETPLIGYFNTSLEENKYAGTPSWQILSLSSNYKYNDKIELNFGLSNIFDVQYRTFASGISQPGRSLELGLSIDF
ncbi:MAG: TonB-dependent receptor [Flavobacteriaceae bacterium]|nr:TonB-dependent receptor [Flavobacteriaceae bacterium]